MKKFEFLNVLFSPFKLPKVKFYIGKAEYGIPYFLPQKIISFDFVTLRWKIKWHNTDYRFETNPMLSIKMFNYQFCVMLIPDHADQYWEAWLYYYLSTDKTLSKKERIIICRKNHPQTYKVYKKNHDTQVIDYYEKILKKKYLK